MSPIDRRQKRELLLPLVLTLAVIAADQIVKALIVASITYHSIGFSWGGDFLWIIHTRNLGVAFSIGYGLPDILRKILFIVVPLAVLGVVLVYYWKTTELTRLQRWCIALIIGGGLGNQIDRIFRPKGVVDFVSVKFYGLFGMERWPAFNIADASIVVGGILLGISFLLQQKQAEQK